MTRPAPLSAPPAEPPAAPPTTQPRRGTGGIVLLCVALGAGCSALVETAQYVLRLDRVSSVDDVLVNTVGAVLAGLASRRWWRTGRTRRTGRAGNS